MIKSIRTNLAMSRDILMSIIDSIILMVIIYFVHYAYVQSKVLLTYAGYPPKTIYALIILKDDPFIIQRIESWGLIVLCWIVICVLGMSVIEGIWALARKI